MFRNVDCRQTPENAINILLLSSCPASKRARTDDPEDGTAMEDDQQDGKTVPDCTCSMHQVEFS